VDLGLNQGAFASAVAERYGCRIIGAEPDPTLFQALPDIKGLEKESIAIGSDGVVKLHLNITCCSSTTFKENGKEAQNIVLVPSMTLQRFLEIKAVDLVHLLKVDIEGAEVAMFDAAADDFLRKFEQITVEFHEFMDHSLSPDVCRIRRRLRRLGFYDIDFTRTRMDVLFINQKFHPLSMWQRLRLRLESYIRGVMRVVGRFLLQKSSHKAANFVGLLLLQAATSRDPSLKKISSPQASGDME
jgi:FkbM family methyltransferase